ncbi:deoxycytidylate deaminase [Bicyclus anynana]|uniref:Probable deoxycytidylate deaminase n=1 Tax=Bicyclus anynana TaxID=110368 RepID=A0A6J1NMJ2_BICAN|nr:deoxycytidylate deaminase [Bicyclus anynana]
MNHHPTDSSEVTSNSFREDSQTKTQKKRDDYLEWKDYFMAVAVLAAKRSKDPNCQVGACIVKDLKIVGVGYNGMPSGCSDDEFPWGKEVSNPLDEKSLYVCHAEMNAIINKNISDLKDCSIYVSLFPCNECAKLIIQSGIREVVYLSEKKPYKPKYMASRRMFLAAGIKCRQFIPKQDKIEINFTTNNNDIL